MRWLAFVFTFVATVPALASEFNVCNAFVTCGTFRGEMRDAHVAEKPVIAKETITFARASRLIKRS